MGRCCQMYPGYLAVYRRYVRTLQQNALLRRTPAYAEMAALLEVLNRELAPGRAGASSAGGPTWHRWGRWPAATMLS